MGDGEGISLFYIERTYWILVLGEPLPSKTTEPGFAGASGAY